VVTAGLTSQFGILPIQRPATLCFECGVNELRLQGNNL
jgi:hypothetical protein